MTITPLGNLHSQVNNVEQKTSTPKLMLGILNMREPFPSYWQAFFPGVFYQEILEPSLRQRAPVLWSLERGRFSPKYAVTISCSCNLWHAICFRFVTKLKSRLSP
uniref:Uncharacterized protein n=1 Tax=Ixodes ricinus TaxID=34613 RepID=A0A6B0UG65_IXORI